ncbi:hypothetical protein HOD08_02190 [bacterium]|nr:hypothetical protein [bacterium]
MRKFLPLQILAILAIGSIASARIIRFAPTQPEEEKKEEAKEEPKEMKSTASSAPARCAISKISDEPKPVKIKKPKVKVARDIKSIRSRLDKEIKALSKQTEQAILNLKTRADEHSQLLQTTAEIEQLKAKTDMLTHKRDVIEQKLSLNSPVEIMDSSDPEVEREPTTHVVSMKPEEDYHGGEPVSRKWKSEIKDEFHEATDEMKQIIKHSGESEEEQKEFLSLLEEKRNMFDQTVSMTISKEDPSYEEAIQTHKQFDRLLSIYKDGESLLTELVDSEMSKKSYDRRKALLFFEINSALQAEWRTNDPAKKDLIDIVRFTLREAGREERGEATKTRNQEAQKEHAVVLEDKNQKIFKLEVELGKKESAIQQLETDKAKLETKLEEMSRSHDEDRKKVSSLESKVEKFEEQLKTIRKEKEKLEKEKKELSSEIGELKKQIEKSQAKDIELEKQIAEIRNKVDSGRGMATGAKPFAPSMPMMPTMQPPMPMSPPPMPGLGGPSPKPGEMDFPSFEDEGDIPEIDDAPVIEKPSPFGGPPPKLGMLPQPKQPKMPKPPSDFGMPPMPGMKPPAGPPMPMGPPPVPEKKELAPPMPMFGEPPMPKMSAPSEIKMPEPPSNLGMPPMPMMPPPGMEAPPSMDAPVPTGVANEDFGDFDDMSDVELAEAEKMLQDMFSGGGKEFADMSPEDREKQEKETEEFLKALEELDMPN